MRHCTYNSICLGTLVRKRINLNHKGGQNQTFEFHILKISEINKEATVHMSLVASGTQSEHSLLLKAEELGWKSG